MYHPVALLITMLFVILLCPLELEQGRAYLLSMCEVHSTQCSINLCLPALSTQNQSRAGEKLNKLEHKIRRVLTAQASKNGPPPQH